jgi:RNA polymerase sigma-70 factor (ECF subfamily)
MQADADSVKRAAEGDREAAGAIYDRYAPLIRAILYDAAGSWSEADDLVQNVFFKALSRLNQLRNRDQLGAWLIQIARREGATYRRSAARRRARFVGIADEHAAPDAQAADTMQTVDVVRAAVRALPEQERIAVHVHYLCEEPADVARRELGLSPSGFYKLLERARGRLQKSLIQRENA